MREPRILDESEIKEIEEFLEKDARISWKDGVLEDYCYTKEFLLVKEREQEAKQQKKRENKIILFLAIIYAIIFILFPLLTRL